MGGRKCKINFSKNLGEKIGGKRTDPFACPLPDASRRYRQPAPSPRPSPPRRGRGRRLRARLKLPTILPLSLRGERARVRGPGADLVLLSIRPPHSRPSFRI